LSSNISTIIKV